MKGFILGLAVGALGVYAALRLTDEETREELRNKVNDVTDKAKAELDHGLVVGKSKALRAGVRARQEVRKGKKKINEVAGDVAGKLAEELSDFEAKAKAKA
ncbi:hypothetical protein [Dysgonomonas sp. BGC7]|uniref:hypothetical protein n=1 Tax=Dysgonomonas sp. BGC7 TaxID=1658008 RepID=UPI0006808BD8|nr:hypothetical protein [Dysgonomonas sp. BGC7]MBD8390099.1 hypothetical protein [Dysgonomonas sp. BGC7]